MIEIQFNMKNSILLAFLATDFCSGLQLFRLDNTFLLAFIAPSNFLTETISMRVTHITGPAHNDHGLQKKHAIVPNVEYTCQKKDPYTFCAKVTLPLFLGS